MPLDSLGCARRPRRNRAAYPHEVAILDEEKRLDNIFMQSLQDELKARIIRARDADMDAQQAAATRMGAELRLRGANAMKDALLRAKNGIESSLSMVEPLFDDLRRLDLEDPTPHLQGIKDILAQRVQCEESVDLQIRRATLGILLARQALEKCLEEEEVAMARKERCTAVINNIENCISGMKNITKPPITCAIWRLPESLWCQIFTEVVGDHGTTIEAEITLPMGSISFPSLILSAVCHSWRAVSQEYPLLWRTIHLTIDPFTRGDKRRIDHYKGLSKGRALRIIIDVPGTSSTHQLDVIANSLSRPHVIESLIVRGGTGGKEVIEHLSKCITPPKALTVAFTDDCTFQRFSRRHSMANNLERLTLKNCSPAGILKSSPPASRKIVQLRVFNATEEEIDWCLFYERFLPLSNTVQELVLATKFSNTNLLDGGAGTRLMSQLTSIAADLTVLLLFYDSRLYTPGLRSLTITSVGIVNNDHWRAYANDQHGGANIIKVNFDPSGEIMASWDAVAAYLHLLPKLSSILLPAQLAHPLLEAINRRWSLPTGMNMKPFGKLKVLSIINYDGNGQQIVSFARNHQQTRRILSDLDSNLNHVERNGMLNVELRNCPNISTQAMAELAEISSVSVKSQ